MRYRLLLLSLALALAAGGAPRAAADDTADCKGVNSLSVGAVSVALPYAAMPASWTLCAATPLDWIGLYRPWASHSEYLSYRATGGAATGTAPYAIPSDAEDGPYELRLFSGKTTLLLAKSPGFYVTGGAPLAVVGSLSHVWASLGWGSVQSFNWQIMPPHAADYLAVYQYGGPGTPVQTCYLNGAGAGQLGCPVEASWPAGAYVGCLYSGLTGAQVACDSTFTVP